MKPYTYLIRSKVTNQVYYGVRVANKLDPSLDLWKKYFTSSKKIKMLILEHGVDSFEYEVRRVFNNKQEAIKWETTVLRRCKVLGNDKWLNGNIAGYILHTPEIIAKIVASHKGKPLDEDHKRKLSESQKGRAKGPLSAETKKLLSDIFSGSGNPMYNVPYTEERRAKQSATMKGRPAHNKGKPMSEEQKKKLSLINSGRKMSAEFRAQCSERNKGRKLSAETKEKIRQSNIKTKALKKQIS